MVSRLFPLPSFVAPNDTRCSAEIAEEEAKPLYTVPTIKEYFQDLDEVLSVISDGPAKSFAWRRLRYLESKWNLYVLLNEYRELAEMKVRSRLRPQTAGIMTELSRSAESFASRFLQCSKGELTLIFASLIALMLISLS